MRWASGIPRTRNPGQGRTRREVLYQLLGPRPSRPLGPTCPDALRRIMVGAGAPKVVRPGRPRSQDEHFHGGRAMRLLLTLPAFALALGVTLADDKKDPTAG